MDQAQQGGISRGGNRTAGDAHGRTFQVDIDPVEPIVINDPEHAGNELIALSIAVQLHRGVGAANADKHFEAGRAQRRHLCGEGGHIGSGGGEYHLRGGTGHRLSEGDLDHVVARVDLVQRQVRGVGDIPVMPVADQRR